MHKGLMNEQINRSPEANNSFLIQTIQKLADAGKECSTG